LLNGADTPLVVNDNRKRHFVNGYTPFGQEHQKREKAWNYRIKWHFLRDRDNPLRRFGVRLGSLAANVTSGTGRTIGGNAQDRLTQIVPPHLAPRSRRCGCSECSPRGVSCRFLQLISA
jgi:hypothetical protein